MTDIIKRLRALARNEHSDTDIGYEGADEIERLTRQLTESQAREQRLREAAVRVVEAHDEVLPVMAAYMRTLGTTQQWEQTCVVSDGLREALALPTDHSALDALLRAERAKERERMANDVDVIFQGFMGVQKITAAIRALGDE